MKRLRPVLIAFMVFFCVLSLRSLLVDLNAGHLDDSVPDHSWPTGRLLGRLLSCATFGGLAIALWRKHRAEAKATQAQIAGTPG
jgi:hypothetical protein